MIDDLLDFSVWTAPTTEQILKNMSGQKPKSGQTSMNKPAVWRHFNKELSPLTTYKYLKARFGASNGLTMLGKRPSIDNLIHWHYDIHLPMGHINFYGHNSGLEIMVYHNDYQVVDKDREKFVNALKSNFGVYGKQMGDLPKTFETWELFINPFARLSETTTLLWQELEGLDLNEVANITAGADADAQTIYDRKLKGWAESIERAASLGITLRMLYPVLLESFVNFVIYYFRREDVAADDRMYQTVLRAQVDIRVKFLHINCESFTGAIDAEDERFKSFQTLMNGRNDFLHGNIDPQSNKVEKFIIDDGKTPVFNDDEGIIKKIMKKYEVGVTKKDVLSDKKIVEEFIELILEKIETEKATKFKRLMLERFPGINSSKQIEVVLPEMVEGRVVFSGEESDDSGYKWFVSDDGAFELTLPVNWTHWYDQYHKFKAREPYRFENITFSHRQLSNKERKEELKYYKTLYPRKLGNIQYYFEVASNDTEFAFRSYFAVKENTLIHFTFTYPKDMAKDVEGRSTGTLVQEAEKILASIKLNSKDEAIKVLDTYRFESF
ncbi:hypothetical protein MKQ70_32245 [Chitinophaga sedimenti]|uniref:hypothetical protein n=1 Tax=Chitinophaga sedimenti TaxID=2033606 RepID=UPI00200685FA|nr:hypothetical protein [Chitinophaga sedimenti]MCK7559389.1 hypothetical protein [Chitinophaga sedimenti]